MTSLGGGGQANSTLRHRSSLIALGYRNTCVIFYIQILMARYHERDHKCFSAWSKVVTIPITYLLHKKEVSKIVFESVKRL
jgi:hypothetical protein